jgi:hypothetical protein
MIQSMFICVHFFQIYSLVYSIDNVGATDFGQAVVEFFLFAAAPQWRCDRGDCSAIVHHLVQISSPPTAHEQRRVEEKARVFRTEVPQSGRFEQTSQRSGDQAKGLAA